jgi:hypothetical protein
MFLSLRRTGFMSRFILPLESRRLFSVTAATLATDLGATKTDSTAVKAALTAIEKAAITDLKSLKTDLKGSPSSNKSLLKTVTTDENQFVAKLKADVTALLKADAVAKHGAGDGTALLKKSSAKLIAKVAADVTALGSATTTPLADMTTDAQSTTVGSALTPLVSANSSNTSLATDAGTTNSDNSTLGAALVTSAQTFASAVGALGADLATLTG